MRNWLPFLVAGLTTGSIYALASMGLVVTYTTSGIFNFAHGAVAMITTYIFYELRVDASVPTWLAVLLTVGLAAPICGAVISRVLLGLGPAAQGTTYVVVSLGLLVALQGLGDVLIDTTRQVAPLFPRSTFRLPGVNVGYDQVWIVAVATAAALVLVAFFRRSRLGLQTQAVVDDGDLAELMGTDARRVTTVSWMLGASFAALSGVLIVPSIGLDTTQLTLLVVYSFGAAAVGRLRSLPRTYVGGVAIGIGAALTTKFVAANPTLAGLPTTVPFVVLVAVLLFSPRGAFAEIAAPERRARVATRRRPNRSLRSLAMFLAGAAAVPAALSGGRLLTATATVAYVLVFASLGLLVGLAGETSMCHAVFVALGATNLAHFLSAGVPWGVALLLAGLAVVPVGALLAIPALRLSGLFLALATFGFGVLVQKLFFAGIFFGRDGGAALPRPDGFAGDGAFYWLVLGVVAIGVAVIEVVRGTRIGRLLRGLTDSPTAMESIGISPTVPRVLVFCLAAFLAGLAGGLLGALTTFVTTLSFGTFDSLIWLTVLMVAGPRSLGGAVLAAVLFQALPTVVDSATVAEWRPVAFGISAMVLAGAGNGLVGALHLPDFARLAERSRWRLDRRRALDRVALVKAGAS